MSFPEILALAIGGWLAWIAAMAGMVFFFEWLSLRK